MKRTCYFAVLLLLSHTSYGQFGDLIKQTGLKIAKDQGVKLLSKELNKTKEKFDSTSFSYAVSLSDKAAQFESKDKLADLVTVSAMFANKEKDKSDLDYARDYMDIGEMAYSVNAYKMAEGSFYAANALLLSEGYEAHPLYGRGLANLGLLYNSMGSYSAAEVYTKQALAVREKNFGKQSIDYAASLNNLAVLNKDLGSYNEAEKEITEAIEINKTILGDESIAYAISLNNRGVLYQTLGRFEDGEKDMKLAIEVAARSLKPSAVQFTRFQSNLALLYQQEGKYEEAEAIYKKALSAIAKNPTMSKKTNPDYAHTIENLAALYEIMGKNEEAEKLYLEALAIYARKFDESYSGYGLTAAKLGVFYLNKNDRQNAEKYLLKAESILNSKFGNQHPYTVDLQVQLGRLYWQKNDLELANSNFTKALDKSMDFVGEYFAPMSDTEKSMYWKTLRPRFEMYYAFTAELGNDEILKQAIQYRIETKAMLLSGTTRIKNKIFQSGDVKLIEDYKIWLDQKGTLAHYYAMSKEDIEEQGINLDSIVRVSNNLEKDLSERSGLFTEAYHTTTPTLSEIQNKLKSDEAAVELIRIDKSTQNETTYLAVILTPTEVNKVVLSNGEELEGKDFKFYRNLVKFKRDDTKSYAKFWQPIDSVLAATPNVFLSLDGVYNQLGIGSLMIEESKYVSDIRHYVIISSLRDLMREDQAQSARAKKAILFGNPTYGSENIDPLPGTGQEINAIQELLNSSGYSTTKQAEDGATEISFSQAKKEGIVHIATHGFFVADPKLDNTSVFSIPLYNVNENVLLRSGVLFAGAGNRSSLTTGAIDNGVLTSYEVMNLDFENTDVVVLSACETGLGDVMSGEGVFGLQRAFMIAGAKAVIMSLWKVDDEATKQLMVNFYKNWLSSGEMEESFAKAQKSVRDEFKHPYYWGSFILLKN